MKWYASSRDRDRPSEPSGGSRHQRAQRVLRDGDGHLWRVREAALADSGPSLIFESEGVFRRVRQYPRDWQELSDDQLFALSWKT
jgi:hypothetical protein